MTEKSDNHIQFQELEPCVICGQPTGWVEINFECRLCLGACTEKMDRDYWHADNMAHLNGVIRDFVEKERARMRRGK